MPCVITLGRMRLITMTTRRYSELIRIPSFEGRYEYLRLYGTVGQDTFGFDRYINQGFYTSREWKSARQEVLVRDDGCDLGVPGHEINGPVLVHHINPMVVDDITHAEDWIVDPEYLITTTPRTHNAIHYGDAKLLLPPYVARQPGDTKLWS